MDKNDAIIQMLRNLSADNIVATQNFYKDIVSLIDSNILEFVETFSKEMKIFDLTAYNKFEKLNLSSKQKAKIGNNTLYRYEYRKNKKNIKCIFVLEREDGRKVLLRAFFERNDKSKGKYTYKTNIKLALDEYERGGKGNE